MSKRRAITAMAVVLLVAGLGWAAFAVLARGASITDSPLVGKPAPVVVLTSLEGTDPVRVIAPGRVMVINFWAPWCVPCLGEHQMLNRVMSRWSADDVGFVGITYQSDVADANDFLNKVGRGVPSLHDIEGRASIEFGVAGVPETFFVDRDGIVRARVAGPLTERLLTDIVDRLLAGTSLAGLNR